MTERNDGISPIPGLLPSASLFGDDEEDTALLLKMAQQAADDLLGFSWCQAVKESYFGDGVGGIVAVFLLRIVPGKLGIPDWLWVLTGDIPDAYLPIEDAETASEALRKYLRASNLWVVMAGQSKSDPESIPLDVPATPDGRKNSPPVCSGNRLDDDTGVTQKPFAFRYRFSADFPGEHHGQLQEPRRREPSLRQLLWQNAVVPAPQRGSPPERRYR